MKSERIAYWDRMARAHFTYTPDGSLAQLADLHAKGIHYANSAQYADNWLSHADEVLGGKPWVDDCDGLASTVLDLCGRDGAALGDRYFLIVMSSGGGHAVGALVDDDGKIWIVGDTFADAPYLAAEMIHDPIDYHRQSDPITVWRLGVPWVKA